MSRLNLTQKQMNKLEAVTDGIIKTADGKAGFYVVLSKTFEYYITAGYIETSLRSSGNVCGIKNDVAKGIIEIIEEAMND